nr:amidohydrolase family protein [Sciscionella sp. SE31]
MSGMRFAGTVLPDGQRREVFVVNGRITTTPVPGAQTVAEDGYLLPGLVDAHCHIGIGPDGGVDLEEAQRQARIEREAGVLLVRDCGVPIDTAPLQRKLELPRIVRSGRHIVRPRRYIRGLGTELEDPAQLPEAVAEQAQSGDGWVKLVGDWIDRDAGDLAPLWPDEVLAEAIAVAHEHGARVTAHVFGEDALPGLIGAGIDCIEHGTGLTAPTIEEMAARGTALVPTLINIENFPDIADSASRYPVYAAHMRDLHARVDQTIGAAIEAGIPVYTGTDAGGGIEHGRIVDEIEALHRCGMSTHAAIGAGSWAARDWLGYLGIADYAAADLLVYDTDPREDLGALRKPRHIVLRGRLIR